MKQAISTMTMIRSLIDDGESASMSMIPNEILFEIFSYLEAPELEIPLDHQSETATPRSSPLPCDLSCKSTTNQKNCTMM